jgi:putative copper export protein
VAATTTSRGSVLSASIDSNEAGTYIVLWQVFAADTHPSRGTFGFAVGRTSANPYASLLSTPEIGTSSPLGLALQALARSVHFAGFALVFGVVAYGVLTKEQAAFKRLVGTGVILLIAAEPLALLGQLASLSFDGDTALAVLGSSFGRVIGLRLGAALLVWTLLTTGRPWPLLGIGGVVALLDGASSHAIVGVPSAGQLLVAVHVTAMGLWMGGIAAFVLAPDRRFRRYAMWTLAITIGTGLLLALAHTHFGGVLFSTDYGRVLLIKVLLVVAALVAAIIHRRRAELAIVMIVVAAAALLAALPPPF